MFVSQIVDEAMDMLGTTDKSVVYRKLSQAVKTLMQSGHWFHTVAEVDICTGWDKQTITLPRGIEVPLAVNVDGSPTYFRDRLFQYHVNKGGMYNSVSWAWDDRGMVATQMDIRQPSQLVAVAEHEADVGKMIRVVGTDGNNRDLRTQSESGEGMDGLMVPIHSINDWPVGSIQPDGVTIQTRTAAVSPLTTFVSATAHQLSSGEGAILSLVSGTLPPGLGDGQKYYVGAPSSTEVQLYTNELDARNQNEPIPVSSITGSPVLKLTDSRDSQLLTVVKLSTASPLPISTATEATFATQSYSALPSPLEPNKTYFVNQQEPTVLQVYETITDAQNEINPVLLLGQNSNFYVYPRSPITPETKLVFPESHGYQNGDIVQAFTNGGTLPQPLIGGTNYYVHSLDSLTEYAVTLHTNYADSISGDNPINLITTGVGQNSIAKLLQATANPGTKNNINVSGLNLPQATGSGAIVTPVVTGPVTSATLVSGGSGYTTATATLSDAGGYKYSKAPAVVFGGVSTTPAVAVANWSLDEATGFGFVESVSMVSGGSGYNPLDPPPVSFVGGLDSGGFHAKAEAVVSTGISPQTISGSQITNGGLYNQIGSIVFFKDTSGTGSGGLGKVATIGSQQSVTSISITKSGSNYTTPQIDAILRDPFWFGLNSFPSTSPSLEYFNVYTLNSSNPVNILNGAIIPWQNDGGLTPSLTFINNVISAINSSSASTLYWAQGRDVSPWAGVWAHPCVKFSVVSVGNTGDSLQSLSISYLDNGTNVSESEFDLISSSGVTQTAGMTPATFATAVATAINSFCTTKLTTVGATTLSDTITFASAPTGRFVPGNCVTGTGLYFTSLNGYGPVFVGSVVGNTVKLVKQNGTPALVSVPNGTVATASIVQTSDGNVAFASGSDVIIRPQFFVKSIKFQQSSTRLQFSFVLPDYPTYLDLNSDFLGGAIIKQIAPTVPSIPTTQVVSAVNLLPVGSGASLSVSVNSVTNTVNGLNVTSVGSDYRYAPRVKISDPNNKNATIQITNLVSPASISAITVLQTNGTTVELLKGVTISSPTSLADAAGKIVVGINSKTIQSGYNADVVSGADDTVVLYSPVGVTVKQITITQTGVTSVLVVPSKALASTSVTTSGIVSYIVENTGSGYTTAPAVTIKGGGGSGASATAVIDENGIGSISVIAGGSGYPDVLNAVISDEAGTGTGATASVTVVGGAINKVTVLTPGKGYITPKISFVNPNGSQMGAGSDIGFTKTGVVTNVNPVTEGTGYVTVPTVTIQPSTGIFVQFSSTGTLPSPIAQGNVYRAENPSSGSSFTLKNTDFSDVNITSTGSGTIYLVLSRAFSIGFTGNWAGEFAGISTATIRLQTDYQLPVTTPSTDTQTAYTLTKVSDTRAIIRTVSPVVQVIPTQLGVGQSYFAIPVLATVNVYNNQIIPSSTEYLTSGMTVQFSSSSGTLPAPLALGTDYKIYPSGKVLTVKTTGGSSIVFTSLGNSQLYMNIIRQFTPKPATTVIVDNCIFETGDQISVRPSTGDTLPYPLNQTITSTTSVEIGLGSKTFIAQPNLAIQVGDELTVQRTGYGNAYSMTGIVTQYNLSGGAVVLNVTKSSGSGTYNSWILVSNYYIGRYGDDLIQVCSSKANASSKSPISLYSIGNTVDSQFIIDSIKDPTLVKAIYHVQKPLTLGYVSLYAFDYGRSNDMALIGQYHPSEVNPKYRRIRIGKPCAWVRMAYRVRPVDVSSDADYIPIENERAVLTALHAVDLEDKDFVEQAQKYWATAFNYLKNETESMDGHAMQVPQINNLVYGDGSDPIVN